MNNDEFRQLIEQGDAAGVKSALQSDLGLANRPIHWYFNQRNESDPLHYICDCVGHGWLTNGKEGEIAQLMLDRGAAVNGTQGNEPPLIASASLGMELMSKLLVEAGAALEATSIFGARALHWAAWVGTPSTVELLIARGADLEARCSEFSATPLFWGVHGYGPNGPEEKKGQVGAVQMLIRAGASVETANQYGLSALEASKQCGRSDMFELLQDAHPPSPDVHLRVPAGPAIKVR